MPPPTLDELRAVGLAAGLVAVGATDTRPFDDTRADLEQRREEGLHGGMQFTYRNPARSTEPHRLLPGARSLLVGAFPYAGGSLAPPAGPTSDRPRGPQARVARYATDDH